MSALKPVRWALLAVALGLAQPGAAAPADEARAAAESLREAVAALKEAVRASDRVAALTRTIGAYEDGLAVMREGLRGLQVRQTAVDAALAARRQDVARLVGAMLAMGQAPDVLAAAHPDGPEARVQAGLLLSALTPAMQAEAQALKTQLDEISMLRALQSEAASTLQEGLDAAQAARTALSEAMQDRVGLPNRFLEDPEELTALIAGADTLDAVAEGLATMEQDIGAPREDFAGARGALPFPVRGTVLRRAGEADAAGIVRPGLVIATEPDALVTAPWPATIRYRGPLLDYRNVMILEPAEGYLMVLAGLGTVYGETGDVVPAGGPLGLMPGKAASARDAEVPEDASGVARSETLYLELRKETEPIDPAPWFRETKDM